MNDESNESMSAADARKAELRRRIQEASAKVVEAQNEIDADQEERDLEAKARRLENAQRDLPHVKAALEEHGEIKEVTTELGTIVLRRPNHLVYKRFEQAASSRKGIRPDDAWNLAKSCIVYPDIARVEEIVEKYPAVPALMANAVYELAKGKAEEVEGN